MADIIRNLWSSPKFPEVPRAPEVLTVAFDSPSPSQDLQREVNSTSLFVDIERNPTDGDNSVRLF